jgi:uncharacterized protein
MKIFITGSNGFVGTNLIGLLLNESHQVTALVRSEAKGARLPKGVDIVVGNSTESGDWQRHVSSHEVLVNLAGTSVFKRWTPAYKQLLRDSRILTTRNLVEAIPDAEGKDVTLLSTSGAGYYGFTDDEELSESAPPGDDFLARLSQDWEAEATKAGGKGVRVVIMRFGVVLGRDGGALAQMALPFKFFAGGPLGDGRQWFPWIHIHDLCRAALYSIDQRDIQGPVNFVAPGTVRNKEFTRILGRVLHRPSFMPAPGFMVRLAMGEFGSVILKGQRPVPALLEDQGFEFQFPRVEDALRDVLTD